LPAPASQTIPEIFQSQLRRATIMKRFLIAVTAATLVSYGATAQVEGQASGSSNSSTSVQAGQNNTNVNSNSSTSADAQASRTHQDAKGNANGNASHDGSASVNGNSVNTSTAGAGSLEAGTTIPATLTKPVDARKAKPGDEITAKTTKEVREADGTVIPRGSRLIGHVTDARAKAKGDSESALGIAFDRAVLRNGKEVPFNASVKALAAAAGNASTGMGDDSLTGAGNSSVGGVASAPASSGGGGGLLGGAGGAVSGATGAVSNTAGGVANGVGNATANVGSTASGTVSGTTRGATGQLTSDSQGVIGLNGLQLNSAASNATQGSVITSTSKDVKLDSGTQMLLQVNKQ
jgi:hypothetical protein